MDAGATLVEMSTVDPATSRAVAAAAAARGVRFIDAPVSGSRAPAVAGRLLVLAGGEAADLARVLPVLETMGRVLHVGPVGAGAALKLAVNALGAHMMVGVAASLVLAARLGVDPAVALDAIQAGAFAAPLHARHGDRILDGNFAAPDFTVALFRKDAELALAAARAAGYDMPTLEAIRRVADEAVAAGQGDDDLAGLVRRFEARAGVTARRRS
jgi:3-hydroxyisobutyrate dehydrogenase-like beta-hydroxyacid dehydrogenase